MIVFLIECSVRPNVWSPTNTVFESLPDALNYLHSKVSWNVSYRVVRIQKDVVESNLCINHQF